MKVFLQIPRQFVLQKTVRLKSSIELVLEQRLLVELEAEKLIFNANTYSLRFFT